MLFEVVIMEKPSKKEVEEQNLEEKMVFGPVFIVAKDTQAAAIRAIMDNPDKTGKVDKNKMEVLVRPFVEAAP